MTKLPVGSLPGLGKFRAEKIVHVPSGHQILVVIRLPVLRLGARGCRLGGEVVLRQTLAQQFEGLLG